MSDLLHPITGAGPVEVKRIDADRVVDGAPMTRTTLDYQRGDAMFVGEWSSEPGAWRVKYEEWEYCHLLEGVCELVPDGGAAQRFKKGDSFVIEPGFAGVWRVIEPMRKRYVVKV
ncbi:MAG: cupin domain-containing protein [Hyphomonadaceae bacterium]